MHISVGRLGNIHCPVCSWVASYLLLFLSSLSSLSFIPVHMFTFHLVSELSRLPACFCIFVFQLNGEPPSLTFYNPIERKKERDSLMCESHACSTGNNASLSVLAWEEEREMERWSSLCIHSEFVKLRERKAAVVTTPHPEWEKWVLMYREQTPHSTKELKMRTIIEPKSKTHILVKINSKWQTVIIFSTINSGILWHLRISMQSHN